ncbi:T9SS type A sorting domain-containing protein [Algibacter pacificus]|uniref:T9SS type A sorting domain-containing protein n=1 Tax=Algibacter pacificus TaxID=2599389 RepID=UPI0011C86F80|nr:T9SS type A sorting domain-containing protein [Algibacter pacificus]
MKKNYYLYLFIFLISSISFAQTNLNFTIDNAIDYGGTGGVTSSDNRIEETITVDGNSYLLKVSCSRDLVLEDLGGGDNIFYSAFSDKETFELLKNGAPINFNFVSIDFDNPFKEGEVTIKNLKGGIFSQNTNAGGQEDGFPVTGTITSDNTINSTNITGFEIDEEIANTLNNVGWHNIQLEIPAAGPTITPDANNILYVDKNTSSGSANGNSWTNAIPELSDALVWAKQNEDPSWATTPLQIWVAQGTYTPGTLETDSFVIPEGTTILGGFNGTETTADARNWAENPTILSGDLNNSLTENPGDSHTIVTMVGNNAEINGFYIQWGYADDLTENSPTFIGRTGAGVYNNGNNKIFNCSIRSNHAVVGAGLVSYGGTLEIINTLFNSNATNNNGGAISAESGTINITNCTIANNNSNNGGGVHFYNGSINATNTIFTNNSGTNGNINDDGPGTGTANYCLFYNGTSGNNGNLPPNITGSNNIENTDPLYTNDYQLNAYSPAIDAGSNTAYTNAGGDLNNDLDLVGNPRINNSTIDIGAYEFQNYCINSSSDSIIYVDANATGTNDGRSWTNAFTDIETALAIQDCGFTGEIRVAGGQTFKPSTSRLCTGGCSSPRDYYFLIQNDIQIKGSYNVSNDTQDYSNPTILSGDVGVLDNNSDNTLRVVVTTNLTNAALLDGFTITQGNANGIKQAVINGQSINNFNGGGMQNHGNPTISNFRFVNNSTTGKGGGMSNVSASPSIINTIFVGNSAKYGGGLYNIGASPTIINTVFVENSAEEGGGIHNFSSSPSIINTTFYGNTTTENRGGGMVNSPSSEVTLHNSVFYANGNDIHNSSVYPAAIINSNSINNFSETSYLLGNSELSFTQLTSDPFINKSNPIGNDGIWGTQDDGLYPANQGVLVNAGDNSFNTESTDITGNPRILNTIIDVGAYELQSTLSTETISPTAFTIYPNPVNHILNIKTPNQKYNYSIYNIQGQVVLKNMNQTSKTINVSKLPSGIYLLKLYSNNYSQNFKIIKQ